MRKDSLSVIVPVHNVERYLERCLESLCAIENINVAFFLVENGSSDSSYSICEKFAKNDSRFVLLKLDEPGVSNARNTALDICDGEYVTFMDADDYMDPKAFEQAFGCCVSKNPDLYFSPFYKDVDGKKELFPLNMEKSEFRDDDVFSEILQKRLAPGIKFWGYVWRVFFKRSIIGDLRFDKQMHYHEDVDFLIRCTLKAKFAVVNDNYAYYSYRINGGSANADPKVNGSRPRLELLNRIENIAKSSGLNLDFAIAQRSAYYRSKQCGEAVLCSGIGNRIRFIAGIHKNLELKHVLLCDSRVFGRVFSIYIRLRKRGFHHLALILLIARYLFR